MSSVDFEKVKVILDEAWRLPPEHRVAFVAQACGDDEELHEEVLSLLSFGTVHPSALDDPAPPSAIVAAFDSISVDDPAAGAAHEIPEHIGAFTILRRMAVGGMGTVYEAQQAEPHRRVALKTLRADIGHGEMLVRFKREAEILGRLHHAGIAHVHEAGTVDLGQGPQPYFAMEFVEGHPLTAWCDEHNSSIKERLTLVARICDAVEHAHDRGIVHRDIKPDNVLVTDDGHPKVLDFGVARVTNADLNATTLVTEIGQIVGTLPYMSPEQIGGEGDLIDTRTDVYSIGVLLYELLAGHRPHDLARRSMVEAARIVREEDATRLGSVDTRLRGDIDIIVGKALEKDIERRYRSAAELAADIRRHLRDEPISAHAPTTFYQLRKFARRNRGLVAGFAVAFAAITAGLVLAVMFAIEADERADEALGAAYRLSISTTTSATTAHELRDARLAHQSAPRELRGWEWQHLGTRLKSHIWEVHIPHLAGYREDMTKRLEWDRYNANSNAPRVQFSSDGKHLIVASAPDELALWSIAEARIVKRLAFDTDIKPHAFDVSHGRVAAVRADGTARLVVLDIASGRAVDAPGFEDVALLSVAWSSDGQALAGLVWNSASSGQLIVGRPGGNGENDIARVVATNQRHGDGLCWAADHTVLAVRGWYGFGDKFGLAFMDTATWTLRHATSDAQRTRCLASGGSLLAAGTWVRMVDIFEFPTDGSVPESFEPTGYLHVEATLSDVDVTPDGRLIASVGDEGELRVRNTRENRLELVQAVGVSPRCALSDDGRYVAVLSDAVLRVWDLQLDHAAEMAGHDVYVYDVAMSPDDEVLASRDGLANVILWDAVSRELLARVPLPETGHAPSWRAPRTLFKFSADSASLGMLFRPAVVGRLDLATDTRWLDDEGAPVSYVAYVPPDLGTPPAWSEPSWLEETNMQKVSADGRWALQLPGTNIIDRRTGREVGQLHARKKYSDDPTHYQVAGSFAPDGTRVAFTDAERVAIYSVPDGERIAVLNADGGTPFGVAWSPDGTRIATGASDGVLRLWDGETYELMAGFGGHRSYIHGVTWSHDGTRIFTCSGDQMIRMWDSVPQSERHAQARTRAAETAAQAPRVSALLAQLGHPHDVARAIRDDATLEDNEERAALRALRPLAHAWWASDDEER